MIETDERLALIEPAAVIVVTFGGGLLYRWYCVTCVRVRPLCCHAYRMYSCAFTRILDATRSQRYYKSQADAGHIQHQASAWHHLQLW